MPPRAVDRPDDDPVARFDACIRDDARDPGREPCEVAVPPSACAEGGLDEERWPSIVAGDGFRE